MGSTLAANANEPRPWKRADIVLAIVSLSLGVAPVVLLGILCLVAWFAFGGLPALWRYEGRPVDGVITVIGLCLQCSLLLLLATWPWFAIFWLIRHGRSRTGKMMALANFLLPVASFVILYFDLLGFAGWWFD